MRQNTNWEKKYFTLILKFKGTNSYAYNYFRVWLFYSIYYLFIYVDGIS